MRRRSPLPDSLGSVFLLSEAAAAGVGRGRANAPDLHRPFTGVRTTEVPQTFLATAANYQHRMKPGHRFCGITAARIWGLPLPTVWKIGEDLHVAVPRDAAPPRVAGVKSRRIDADRGLTVTFNGLRAIDPISTALLLAAEHEIGEVVAMLDALVTPARHYPDLHLTTPYTSIDGIRAHMEEFGPFRGVDKVRRALELTRPGADSPKETETRLAIVAAGLPEPVLQFAIRDGAVFVATVDLAYPELKIAIEYEGDGHRTDKAQWRTDIQRKRRLEALGWIVIRVTQLDLAAGHAEFIALLARAIRSRTR